MRTIFWPGTSCEIWYAPVSAVPFCASHAWPHGSAVVACAFMTVESISPASWSRSIGPRIGEAVGSLILIVLSSTFVTWSGFVSPRMLKSNTEPAFRPSERWIL